MKKQLYILAVLGLLCVGLGTRQAHAIWLYDRSITVTSTAAVASGTNSNFPMLVSSTFSSFEPVSDGGRIQNLCANAKGMQEPCESDVLGLCVMFVDAGL